MDRKIEEVVSQEFDLNSLDGRMALVDLELQLIAHGETEGKYAGNSEVFRDNATYQVDFYLSTEPVSLDHIETEVRGPPETMFYHSSHWHISVEHFHHYSFQFIDQLHLVAEAAAKQSNNDANGVLEILSGRNISREEGLPDVSLKLPSDNVTEVLLTGKLYVGARIYQCGGPDPKEIPALMTPAQ